MAAETLIERMAKPIPGGNPAGIETRGGSAIFRRIKDAANEARRIEKKAELSGGTDVKEEDRVDRSQALTHWRIVADEGKEILATQSKDLEIASFVIEAVTRLDGFSALSEAFQWTRLLVENFWDHLYPVADDEDGIVVTPTDQIKARVHPIERLSGGEGQGLLIGPLTWVELTEAKGDGPFCSWQYKQAIDLEKLDPKERDIRINRGNITKAQFEAAIRDSSADFCQKLVQDTEACVENYRLLIEAVTKKIAAGGLDKSLAPSSSSLMDALKGYVKVARAITLGRLPVAAESPTPGEAPEKTQSTTAVRERGGLATREDAFTMLNKVADFFESLEPQSLLPHQLRKLIRQGRLKPADYFLEMIEDPKISAQLLKSCGLEPKVESKKGA